jgi:hypothetical protein
VDVSQSETMGIVTQEGTVGFKHAAEQIISVDPGRTMLNC